MKHDNWYEVTDTSEIDSPALLVYPQRVAENIRILKGFVDHVEQLRPHVKTHKSPEITQMLIKAGITKFKCATIAEAEMLASNGALDVLLAHQPVGPKVTRLLALIEKYPNTQFSFIYDEAATAQRVSEAAIERKLKVHAWIDLNIGMNRTGITPNAAFDLYKRTASLDGIVVVGLHAYDGHLREPELETRRRQCNDGYAPVERLQEQVHQFDGRKLTIVAGGTPSFPIHAQRSDVECSPGTFIYWDKGYQAILKEQPFLIAAIVLTRVISIPTPDTICVDLGHKGIASENPIDKRVYFLNALGLTPIAHSEEHLVLKTEEPHHFQVGDVLYGIPHHICPTVNLYDSPYAVVDQKVNARWQTTARSRKIEI